MDSQLQTLGGAWSGQKCCLYNGVIFPNSQAYLTLRFFLALNKIKKQKQQLDNLLWFEMLLSIYLCGNSNSELFVIVVQINVSWGHIEFFLISILIFGCHWYLYFFIQQIQSALILRQGPRTSAYEAKSKFSSLYKCVWNYELNNFYFPNSS